MYLLLPRFELAQVLRARREAVLETWLSGLRADPVCQPVELLDDLATPLDELLVHLAEGLEAAPVDLSDEAYRPLVRELSFLGGWLAARRASPSLLVKLPHCLGVALASWLVSPREGPRAARERPATPPEAFLDADRVAWADFAANLSALLCETYCRSLRADAKQQEQATLEQFTPLCRLPGPVPVLLLVGSPDRTTLSALLGRLVLEVARLGANAVAVDFTHAGALAEPAWLVLGDLLAHRKLVHRTKLLCALPKEGRRALAGHLTAPGVHLVETWDELLAEVGLDE